nr:MAG TPA: hypothetical protein [Caudoviricetes sp.]
MKHPYTRLLTSTTIYLITLTAIVTNTGCANLTTILELIGSTIAGTNALITLKTITERNQQ